MRSISLAWTAEISYNEIILLVSTVQEAIHLAWTHMPPKGNLVPLPKINPYGNWVLPTADQEIAYASFAWYQKAALDTTTGYLHADHFLDLVVDEPWQQDMPHYDLALVHQPLVDQTGYSVFGLAARGQAAVLSIHTLHMLKDAWQQLMLLRRLTAHYVGHVLAVPINKAHCTNICAMRPTTTLSQLIAYSRQEGDADSLYCEQCQTEMSKRLVGCHFGNN